MKTAAARQDSPAGRPRWWWSPAPAAASAGPPHSPSRPGGPRSALLARGEEGLAGAVRDVEAPGGTALAIPIDVADPDRSAAAEGPRRAGPHRRVGQRRLHVGLRRVQEDQPDGVQAGSPRSATWATSTARWPRCGTCKARDPGTIVQVGSALAYRGIPLQTAYCGAKHAIQGFHESLRCELLHDKSNVHVTMVQMPAVNTPQFDWVLSRLPRPAQPVPPIYQPEVAARGVLYAADHPKRREYWVGGTTMGTLIANAIAPGLLDRYLGQTGFKSQEDDRPESPDARSTCGSPPTGRTAMTTPPTAASTTRPTRSDPAVGFPAPRRARRSAARPGRRGRRHRARAQGPLVTVRAETVLATLRAGDGAIRAGRAGVLGRTATGRPARPRPPCGWFASSAPVRWSRPGWPNFG